MRSTYLFFFNDSPTTETYTLSLHDALPICGLDLVICLNPLTSRSEGRTHARGLGGVAAGALNGALDFVPGITRRDRKSTRLNSSHANISYAVFCLKKKNISHSAFHVTKYSR